MKSFLASIHLSHISSLKTCFNDTGKFLNLQPGRPTDEDASSYYTKSTF